MDLLEVNNFNPNRHPWELSRAEAVLKLIKEKSPDLQYVDIGAGDLFFTKELARYINKPIIALDINYKNLYREDKIIQLNDPGSLTSKSADCVILMDVLEHIKDEYPFLEYLSGVLKENGEFIITVPAYRFLFSQHDTFLRHYRRYNKRQLRGLLAKLNMEIKEMFYFFTILFIIRCIQIALIRLNFLKDINNGISSWKYGINSIITKSIKLFLNIDFSVNRFIGRLGFGLPGLSLCAVCKKKTI